MKNDVAPRLLAWYKIQGRRDLPWRRHITPYRVWLSEIMLQQTQVKTVIPYFEKFIQAFPDIKKLAQASEDEVLHLWSGLGYYSRARNLHKTAKLIVAEFQSEFPRDIEGLMRLPGVGRSTAGAIAAIAYRIRAPILDGNVKRVISRMFAVTGWAGESPIQKRLWMLSEALLPEKHVADYTQALMDLGATVCKRSQPACERCPLQKYCLAYAQNKQNELPTPSPRKNLPEKTTYMLIIQNQTGEILLIKKPTMGIWGGLWSFPECNRQQEISRYCQSDLGIDASVQQYLAPFRHTFSHFHLQIYPVLLTMDGFKNQIRDDACQYQWIDHQKPVNLGLPAPVKQILKHLHLTLGA